VLPTHSFAQQLAKVKEKFWVAAQTAIFTGILLVIGIK
jgi:uncharacterized membrane protein